MTQVERLGYSSQALEKDNKGLRDELKTAHINLHKIKESNNVLHETITKLKQLVRVPKGCQHVSKYNLVSRHDMSSSPPVMNLV